MKWIKSLLFVAFIVNLPELIQSTEHQPWDSDYVYLVRGSQHTRMARVRPFLEMDDIGNFKQHVSYLKPQEDKNASNITNQNDTLYVVNNNNNNNINRTILATTISANLSTSGKIYYNRSMNMVETNEDEENWLNNNNNQSNQSQKLEQVNFELPSWNLPIVIVAIPTFNRKEFLYQSLEYVKWQQYPRDRIHVAILDDSPISLFEDGGKFNDTIESLKYVGITVHYKHRILNQNRQENIGQKRNSLVRWVKYDIPVIDERDYIIIHWDDDDWHAPHRIMKQVYPLMNGQSKLSALDLRTILILHENKVYYRWAPAGRNISNAMPIMSVNGGTLAYWISVYNETNGLRFPNLGCGEDIMFVDRVVNAHHRVTILDDSDISVIYMRHKGNTWGGLDPSSWILLEDNALPPRFVETLPFYHQMQNWNRPNWNGRINDGEEYWVCSHHIDEIKNLVVNEIRGL